MSAPDHTLIELLHRTGRRVTPQRLLVHRVVSGRRTHLSAEQIHAAVAEQLPGTSVPTIYATLDLLCELGLTRRVQAGGRTVLFDGHTAPHAHLACRRCGEVRDLDDSAPLGSLLRAARGTGFLADHADAVISGLCDDCARGRRPRSRGSARVHTRSAKV
ncbi:MAG TPA: Fur family transcriptional regulator [Solirubrobacteraceae bacterium]|jgi:Fur family ferric uptake transcriptional regulator/Fur family peroxide stress response transcriptional regulator|nr:Fur family transcriptional regulator [Solirubrobacteraceae bacterium]